MAGCVQAALPGAMQSNAAGSGAGTGRWTQSSTQLEAGPSSPLLDPPCICSPFRSPAASCTCTPRPRGIYPAPGTWSEGSALINLSGTGAQPSCLACTHRESLCTSGELFYLLPRPAPTQLGPGCGMVAHGEDGALCSRAPLPAPSTLGNPRYVGGGMKSFWSSSKPLQLSGASADCGTCLVTDEASNPLL